MMKSRARLLLMAAVIASPALLAGQQQTALSSQTPTFKLQVNYVEVDVVVTDKQGHFVRDLKKSDFTVLEDGKPQTITTFSHVNIPVTIAQRPLFSGHPIQPDVQSNAHPFTGRVYVMVLDSLHTKAERTALVRQVASQFIKRDLGANDVMAILEIGGPTTSDQDFTSNKQLLLAAVDKFVGGAELSRTSAEITDAFDYAGQAASLAPPHPTGENIRSSNARVTVETLRNVVGWMQRIRGRRKALLFVSEGLDYNLNQIFGNQFTSTVLDDVRNLISVAARSNVNIYGIDPRGLSSVGGDDIAVGSLPASQTGLGPGTFLDATRQAENSLRVLSDETGGFAVLNQNDFQPAFRRIVADNSSYYVLGYYPTNEKRDGKFRKIQVKVDRPGVIIQARPGYMAPKGKVRRVAAHGPKGVSAQVREALNSPLPVPGLTLHVFAAPFKGSPHKASVLLDVEASGRNLHFRKSGGRYDDKIDVAYQAIGDQGKVRAANRDTINLQLKPATEARTAATGVRLLNRLQLAPGRYQIRVAARETGGDLVGGVRYYLTVPNFYKPALSMSGLVLTSATASHMPTVKPDPYLKPPVMPAPPAALRVFPPGDTLALYTEIYDNDTRAIHKDDIVTTVRTDAGTVVYRNAEARSTAEFGGKRGGFDYTARVPLRGLAPGLYVLKVKARSELGHTPSVDREIQFTIAPAAGHPVMGE